MRRHARVQRELLALEPLRQRGLERAGVLKVQPAHLLSPRVLIEGRVAIPADVERWWTTTHEVSAAVGVLTRPRSCVRRYEATYSVARARSRP